MILPKNMRLIWTKIKFLQSEKNIKSLKWKTNHQWSCSCKISDTTKDSISELNRSSKVIVYTAVCINKWKTHRRKRRDVVERMRKANMPLIRVLRRNVDNKWQEILKDNGWELSRVKGDTVSSDLWHILNHKQIHKTRYKPKHYVIKSEYLYSYNNN